MTTSHTLSYATSTICTCVFRFLFVLISLASVSTVSGQVPAPQQPETETTRSAPRKQSTVHGRVVYEDNRRPLRRVQVSIYDPAGRGRGRHFMAWTDGRGEFQIRDVPAGKYFVEVSAPGVIRSGPYDSEEVQRELTSVTVDGASRAEALVRVRRGGAISGKVTYADGDPAINTSITILRKKEGKWVSVYVGGPSTDRTHTDERGVYRVSGLSPGEYLVGAAEEKMGIELSARDDADGGRMLNRALLTTTYFDAATNLAGATVLIVSAGAEEKEINITLAERAVHSISGVVTLKGERPIARARISLRRTDEESILGSNLEEPVTNTDVQGRFTLEEVQDGNYRITVTPARDNYPMYGEFPTAPQAKSDGGQSFAPKNLELTVAGADLSDIMIEVSSGSRISGSVAVEGGKPLPRTLFVYPEAGGVGGQVQLSRPARAQPDGTFALDGLPPGAIYLRAMVAQDNKYFTKSVTLGKTDLLRESLLVKEGEDVSNVRIVISADTAHLSGRILASDGKSPERGVWILLVPADLNLQKPISGRIYGITNADGGFSVSGAPGDYLAIVMRPGESAYQLTTDALRSRTTNARRLTLQPGENTSVDIVAPNDK
ncbi:MAG: carboxypeptidase regulatory-like domain-containing protein [Pyrinomonadaceae bacterium]|nr:carboxypeptidase regulatory-like domain-containing protein [Pyrinomonadaceae bacterium]